MLQRYLDGRYFSSTNKNFSRRISGSCDAWREITLHTERGKETVFVFCPFSIRNLNSGSCHAALQWRHNERDGFSNNRRLVCSGADQRKHQSSASLAFVRGIHRSAVNSPHKGPVTRKMFPYLMTSSCVCFWHIVAFEVTGKLFANLEQLHPDFLLTKHNISPQHAQVL